MARGVGFSSDGYPALNSGPKGETRLLHVIAAEKALGRKLPKGAVVHHVDGGKLNYANSNLVVCPSNAYHKLLHARMDALLATGNPEHVRCSICGTFAAPTEMRKTTGKRTRHYHNSCRREYDATYERKR